MAIRINDPAAVAERFEASMLHALDDAAAYTAAFDAACAVYTAMRGYYINGGIVGAIAEDAAREVYAAHSSAYHDWMGYAARAERVAYRAYLDAAWLAHRGVAFASFAAHRAAAYTAANETEEATHADPLL